MRIISGKYKSRKLVDSSYLKDLRPTTDSNRENLFNILGSSKKIKETGFDLRNCNFLDIFCGTGAVSFEALSRGVKFATLIDINQKHLQIVQQNADLLKENNIEYFCIDALRPLVKSPKCYNLIFLDPPYQKNLIKTTLENLDKSNWIAKNALIVIEHSKKEVVNLDEDRFAVLEERRYGNSVFTVINTKSYP
jgi:16S rRNA (guanine966-N2)-methyltransferase